MTSGDTPSVLCSIFRCMCFDLSCVAVVSRTSVIHNNSRERKEHVLLIAAK
jgi:hypothetical protein